MSSTSRVLQEDQLSQVQPVWWRDAGPPPAPVRQPAQVAVAPVSTPSLERSREQTELEAYQRGFLEGKAVGQEQASAEAQPVMDRLSRALAELSALRTRVRTEGEKDLLKLSIAVARRVLHRELTLDPESIEGLIKVALAKLESRELCRVRVHPDQAEAIRGLLERFSNSHKIELTPDASLQCGDVLFETEHGTLDASIESQLDEIERGFADRLRR